jgi:hypothetical protein
VTAYIYFMRPVGCDGPIKVGFSVQPKGRLAAYQAWSPIPLEIIAVLPEPPVEPYRKGVAHVRWTERRFHERYYPWHMHHEWFAVNELLLADIAAIQAGTFDPSELPEPTEKTWRLSPATRGTKGHVGRPNFEKLVA